MYSMESLEEGMIHVLSVMEWDGVKFSSCHSEQCINLLFISGIFSFNNRGAGNHGYLQLQPAVAVGSVVVWASLLLQGPWVIQMFQALFLSPVSKLAGRVPEQRTWLMHVYYEFIFICR